jgi:hypothetical protein
LLAQTQALRACREVLPVELAGRSEEVEIVAQQRGFSDQEFASLFHRAAQTQSLLICPVGEELELIGHGRQRVRDAHENGLQVMVGQIHGASGLHLARQPGRQRAP